MVTSLTTAGLGYLEGPVYSTGGTASQSQVIHPDPQAEIVVSASSWIGAGSMDLQVLAQGINSSKNLLSIPVIQAMLEDDAVGPAFETLKLAALSGDLTFHPSVEADADPLTNAGADPEEAKRAADFCRRAHDRLETPINLWAKDALNALAYGHKLAELVFEYLPTSDTDGHWTLGSLVMKPANSYHLVADRFMHLKAVYCQTDAGPAYVDIEHFVHYAWDVRDSDPRGTSILQAAKDPWRRKLRAKESRSKGDDQFGTPSVVMVLPANAPVESKDPANNLPVSTVEMSRRQLATFQNGGAMVVGNGGDVKVIESQRDGVQISNSIDSYDRAITRALLLQAKATMEAKHYTQGGGEIGEGLIEKLGKFLALWFLAATRKQVFHRLLARNKGRDYADTYTPFLRLGDMPMEDFVKLAAPISVLGQAGLLTSSQLGSVLRRGGLPNPLAGELRIGPSGLIPNEVPQVPPKVEPKPAGGNQP